MDLSTHFRERIAAPRRHAWACFCLVLFLLYNPYMVAPSSPDGLNIRHPASHRATVGASELQHFSPANGNINIPIFNGFLFSARGKAAELQTEVNRQKLAGLRNNIARDVRTSWQDTARAYERLSVTEQLREQAGLALDLAQARYNLGLGFTVEFSQAEVQKTEGDIADTDARYQYRLTQIVLAYTISSSK
jgi:outer membrane protein TolC